MEQAMTRAAIRAQAVSELLTEPEVQQTITLAKSLGLTTLDLSPAEYDRRNLLGCKAYGAHATAKAAIEHLELIRHPKWLMKKLRAIEERTAPLGAALAEWRRGDGDR